MLKGWHAVVGTILLAAILLSGCGGIVAKTGDTVKVHYTGTYSDGTVLDTSSGRESLEFTIGQGQLIQGFELAVIGMKAGESKTVNIPAAQAYGLHRNDLVFTMDLDQLPDNVAVDQQYEVTQNDGSIVIIKILDIFETTAMIDANHPLAGEDLIFEIELIEIE